jgi:predicted permease
VPTAAIRQFLARLQALVRWKRNDEALDEEIRAHLDLLTTEHLRRGLSPTAGRAAARRDFGAVDQMKERYRDQRAFPVVDAFAQDIRYAMRTLRRSPGFVAAVVLSLAVGIGVNSAVFTLLNALMFTSLPVRSPQELFIPVPQAAGNAPAVTGPNARYSYPAFEALRGVMPAGGTLAAMSRVARMYRRLDAQSEPQATAVQLVSGEFFSMLGVSAARGRVLGLLDNLTPGGHAVGVMSHTLWSSAFGADPAVIGRSLNVNGQAITIVGVAPPGFSGVWLEQPVDLWIPLMMQQEIRYRQNYSAADGDAMKPWVTENSIRWLNLIGRRPAGDRGATEAALTIEFQRLLSLNPPRISDPSLLALALRQRLALQPFGEGFSNLRTRFAPPLFALFALAALILVIACANTANLLLARAAAREREIAVRLSIGASRNRVVRQLLTESAILAALACAGGLLLSGWTADLLVRRTLAGPVPFAVGVDGRVVAFAVVAAVLTVLLAGLMPAYRVTSVAPGSALRDGSSRGSSARPRLQKTLVASQIALSLVLVVSAGLFAQTLRNYAHLNLGFSQEHVLTVSMNPLAAGYAPAQLGALSRALLQRVESVPGVASASTAMCSLATGCRDVSDVTIDRYQPAPGEAVQVQENRVSPDYFSTTGMRLVEGRNFDSADREGTSSVAIVNQAMARKYFGGQSPLGRRFGYRRRPDVEIVGVVEDARVNSVQQAPVPMAFYPMAQGADPEVVDVRAVGDPHNLMQDVRRAVSEVAPDIPIISVTILSEQVAGSLNQERLVAGLTAIFGVLALGLASLGLFGVMSYAVARRTMEFGIRLALGAQRAQVLTAVLRESLAVGVAGLAVGIPAVLIASRLLATFLFGIGPADPATLAGSAMLLAAVAAAAGLLPAWNASRVEPIIALKHE